MPQAAARTGDDDDRPVHLGMLLLRLSVLQYASLAVRASTVRGQQLQNSLRISFCVLSVMADT